MKTRNQKGLESKYWLLIIVAACILCMAATFFAGVKSRSGACDCGLYGCPDAERD